MTLTVNTLTQDDFDEVLYVARKLPEWFTESGIEEISIDLNFQHGLVVKSENKMIGFITYYTDQGKAHIGWLAVSPNYQGKGLGLILFNKLKEQLSGFKIKQIFVSTLGDSVDYHPYEKTRSFYRKIGFQDYEVKRHDDNPEMEEELILCYQIS